jgi:SAM-dependent methyltransferase
MIKCPICASGQAATILELDPQQSAQHFISLEGSPERSRDLACHIRKLWGGTKCFVRECSSCHFGFSDPFVAGDARFYQLAYERAKYPSERWEFRRTLKELSSTKFRADRILEVGAGFGFFLDKVVGTYVPRSGIAALEYSEEAIGILRGKGYSAQQNDLRAVEIAGHFNAIFLFQVVEHMDNLDDLFASLYRLLDSNGALFIAVPNQKRIMFNEMNESLLDVPPNHIGRWSPAAFEIIGARHGLRLDRHELEPFSLIDFVIRDIAYSYLRRAQKLGTMENWSRSLRSKWYGKLIGAVVAALHAPRRIGTWWEASRSQDLGSSLWVKFTKKA